MFELVTDINTDSVSEITNEITSHFSFASDVTEGPDVDAAIEVQYNFASDVQETFGFKVDSNMEGGVPGPKGDPGTGIRIVGTLATEEELPESAPEGDSYLIEGDLWLFDGTSWSNVGQIQGPAGRDAIKASATAPLSPINGDVWSRTTDGALFIRVAGAWLQVAQNGTDGLDGSDGRPVELNRNSTHIQWRYLGDVAWINLLPLLDIKGDPGDEVEFQKTDTHIQWRYTGGDWEDLVALIDIQGNPGADGTDGDDGTAATITIGTVTTGAAGSEVEVVNSGTSLNAILDITIPQGDTGAAGAGVPAGGATGQVLVKATNADYDYTWTTPSGSGDMLASVYDPTNKAADAFSMGNMVETTTKKVMTDTERTKLTNAVTGPASSADNTIARYNGTTGKVVQGSGVQINDADDLYTPGLIESDLVIAAPQMAVDEIIEYYVDSGLLIENVLFKDGLVDGRSLPDDGDKLDGIEPGAQMNEVSAADLATKANATDLSSHTGNTSNPHGVTKAQVGLSNVDNTSDASKLAAFLNAAYPVGSIYINANVSTNPATLLGIGTWEAWGVGKAIVGIDTTQTEFDTAEETGGEKTHTLTTSEMPSHSHTQAAHSHQPSNTGFDFLAANGNVAVNGTSRVFPATGSTNNFVYANAADNVTINEYSTTNSVTPAINNTGGDGAHNNLQPYQVGYVWKRTA